MRRLLRALLVVLVVLVILVGGLFLAGHFYLTSESARRRVASRLEEVYGGPVEIDEADLGVLGDSTLRGLRLYEPGKAGEAPWATFGTVKTDVSVLELARGVMPRRITVGDASVTLRIDRSGRLLMRLPEGATRPKEGALPDIQVESGQVTLQQEGRPEMVVKGVRLDAYPDGDRIALSGAVSDQEWGDWSIDGSAEPGTGAFDVTLKTDRADVTQDKLLRLPFVPAAVWKEVEAQGITPVEFTFRHEPEVNRYRVVLHPAGAAITLPTLALHTQDVRGGITVEDAVVTLDKVSGRALGGELGADGTLDFRGQENIFHLVVTAKELDVRQVPEHWDLDDRLRRLGGKLSGKADLTVRFDGDVHTSGEGKGELTGVTLGGKPTTIELSLHPTRKGFRLGQPPAKEGRLPANPVRRAEYRVHSTEYTVPSTQYRVHSTEYTVPSTQYRVHSTEYRVLSAERARSDTQYSVPSTQYPVPSTARPILSNKSPSALGTRYSVLGTPLATVLLQAPPEAESSVTRAVTGAVQGGINAVGRAVTETGTKAVGLLPRGDITKPAPAATPPTYLDISLNLKDVDLAQLVKDVGVKVPFDVSGRLSMKVQASLPVDRPRDLKTYKVTGTATLPTFNLSGVDMKDVSARVRYDDGVLRLEDVRGQLVTAGSFSGSARLGVVPEGDLTADLKLTDIPLAQVLRAAGIKEEVAGSVSGSADLRVPAGRLRDLSAWQGSAKLKAEQVRMFGWELTDAGATVRVGKGLLTVRDVTGKLEGATVSGSAEAKLTAPYTYEGKLELPKGDLASLRRLAPGLRPPLAVTGRFGITAEVSGTLSPFTAKLSGSGTGQDVKVEKVSVESVRFRWAPAGDVLKLTDVKASLYGGEVTGSADVPLDPKRDGKVDLRFDGVDVGALVRDVPAVPLRLEGKAGGSVKGTLKAADGERAFDADVELSSPRMRVQNLPTEKLTGTFSYHKGAGEYHLKGGLLGGTFELDGKIPPRPATAAPPDKPERPADSRLRIRGAQLGRLGEALGARGALDQLHGRVDLDVDFRLEGLDYTPVGSGDFRVTRLRWGDQEIADAIRGDVILSEGEMRLRNLSGELGGGTLRGRVSLRLRDPDRSSFNVAVDGADAARVLAPWPALAANVTGTVDARLRGTLGRQWSGGGTVALTRGKVLGVEVSELRLPLRFDFAPARGRAQIEVEETSATVARGRVSGRASLGFGIGTHLEGRLRFSGVDLQTLLRPFTESTQLGSGQMSGRIEFSGTDVRSLDDVTATVDASFAQAQAFQLPILSQIAPFLVPGRSSTTFQSGDLRGRLSNGIFRVQRLSLSGNAVNLFVEGNVTTSGRLNLDVTATTQVVGTSAGLLRLLGLRLPLAGPIPLSLLLEATGYLSSTSIHAIVTGTVRSPTVRIEPLSLLTEEAARFFLLRSGGAVP